MIKLSPPYNLNIPEIEKPTDKIQVSVIISGQVHCHLNTNNTFTTAHRTDVQNNVQDLFIRLSFNFIP